MTRAFVFITAQDGLRGLDHACFLGHEETARLLVSHGASVKTVSGVGTSASQVLSTMCMVMHLCSHG